MPELLVRPTSRRDDVIKLRQSGLSYAKIGESLGISRERVRQILKPKPRSQKKPVVQFKVMLRISDVARLLNVHSNTVRRWSNKGVLKSYRISSRGDRRFKREDVDALIREDLDPKRACDVPSSLSFVRRAVARDARSILIG